MNEPIKYEFFDWDIAQELHSEVTYQFLRDVHNTAMTEEDFAKRYAALPREGKLHASRSRNMSHARSQYRRLKEKFGFFTSPTKKEQHA